MRILSFDPASVRNLGWAFINLDQPTMTSDCGTAVLTGWEEPWEALWPLFNVVNDLIEKIKPDNIIVEKTSSFSGGFVTGQVSNCMGVILACLGKHKFQSNQVHFVYPTHVKKVVTGNGKAKKAEIKKNVIAFLDEHQQMLKFTSEHDCDAIANIICWLKDCEEQSA